MFTTDSRTENFLTSLGAMFRYTNGIRLPEDLVPKWDAENLGRPVAVRDDAVIEYATLMDGGSPAPATILLETPAGYMVLDGVQRLSAAVLQQITQISAYVVTTDSANLIAAIRVLANARMQGRAEPAEWTRRRAVEVLVVGQGMTPVEVARMGGWKAADIKKIAEAIEMQRRVTSAGGPDLTDAMLTELAPFLQGSSVLEQATVPVVGFLQTLRQSKLAAADAAAYIKVFFAPVLKSANPFKTYSKRLEEVHEDPEIRARITGRQTTELPKDVVLLRALKAAETILDQAISQAAKLPNLDEFLHILGRMERKLKGTRGKR